MLSCGRDDGYQYIERGGRGHRPLQRLHERFVLCRGESGILVYVTSAENRMLTRYIVSACSVLIFDVFAQLARKSALSVAFCSLRNKSSFVMPNCDLACNGDTDAAAAIHTARIRATQEFWLGLPSSIFIQNRSNIRLKEGICRTCASGLTDFMYCLKSTSASNLEGSCGGSTSLL